MNIYIFSRYQSVQSEFTLLNKKGILMLQHNYSTERITRLHTEAKNVRLAQQVKTHQWRKTLAHYLSQTAKRLDNELEVPFKREIPT